MEAVSRPGASQEAHKKQLNFHFACVFGCYNHDGSNKKKKKKDGSFVLLHRPGIEPGSRPWQGRILPLDQRCLRLQILLMFDAGWAARQQPHPLLERDNLNGEKHT